MYPTTLYAELTPNPNTMKFVADRIIFSSNNPVEYKTQSEAKGSSQLALELFNFPFVNAVFIAKNFVTITKSPDLSWDFITFELREFVRQYLIKTEFVVENPPQDEEVAQKVEAAPKKARVVEPSEYDTAIKNILFEMVKPAVESDGGAIDFVSFKDGVVTVELRGSCSGCPSSTITLKKGIERILTSELPAVKEVVAQSV